LRSASGTLKPAIVFAMGRTSLTVTQQQSATEVPDPQYASVPAAW
jgi:hypothetical protein